MRVMSPSPAPTGFHANLDDKVVVVTGARGQLGSYWCELLLAAGARVVALDVPGARAVPRFEPLADKVLSVEADITDKNALETARQRINTEFGPVYGLVNNAGIDQPPSATPQTWKLEDIPESQISRVLEVNTIGAFYAMQVFGKDMIAQNAGSIVNIGSLYATVSPDVKLYDHIPTDPPFIKPPAYGASKAALYNLTRYVATHWGPHRIRVNLLSPGGVEANQDDTFKQKFNARVPLGRMAQLDDLAGPMLFLLSDASQYVTGLNLQVDGGFTLW